jgi:hypothetical protein
VSEFAIVVEAGQIGFIKGFILSIGQVKRLLEVGFNILLHDLVHSSASSIFIQVLKQIIVYQIDLIVLPRFKVNQAGIACVMNIFGLNLQTAIVFRLRNWINVSDIFS